MKIALVTTTINVPRVLELYRVLGPDVRFFVALDKKSEPHFPYVDNTYHITVEEQGKWKCSELIGWSCIQRRNIAILEALKWGADVIVTIDDDNIPLDQYFQHIQWALCHPLNGIKVRSKTGWFDPGQLLSPAVRHRGFPHDVFPEFEVSHVTNARVGVAAGLCLGDPDISAVDRISRHPTVHQVTELGRAGVVVDPNTRTVFNSQNTAFIRELAPAMFLPPGLGRYDDIFASLICQTAMRAKGLHVHFGQPFVWQQRNEHNLLNDLEQEMLGMRHVQEFAELLDRRLLADGTSILRWCRWVHTDLNRLSWWPQQASSAALAFLDDCDQVLG